MHTRLLVLLPTVLLVLACAGLGADPTLVLPPETPTGVDGAAENGAPDPAAGNAEAPAKAAAKDCYTPWTRCNAVCTDADHACTSDCGSVTDDCAAGCSSVKQACASRCDKAKYACEG